MARVAFFLLAAGVCLTTGCSPSLNWRECRLVQPGVQLLFPCKPEAVSEVGRGMVSCRADGRRYALTWVDSPDPAMISQGMARMRISMAQSLGLPPPPLQSLCIKGMTASEQAGHAHLATEAAHVRAAWFTRGRTVFQLAMLGEHDDAEAWGVFVQSVQAFSEDAAARP